MVVDPKTIARLAELKSAGTTKAGAAKTLGLARGTARKYWRQLESGEQSPVQANETDARDASAGESRSRRAEPDPLLDQVRRRQAKLQIVKLERQHRRELRELQRDDDEALLEANEKEHLAKEVERLRKSLATESSQREQLEHAARQRQERDALRIVRRTKWTGLFHCLSCYSQHKLIKSDELKCAACGGLLVAGESP